MSYKILLADDSVTVQKIVTLTFSDEGVDVVPVNNGDDAIKRLQSLRPALVMADVSIPGKNGYEICAYVKSHPELKHIPVILLVPAFEPFDDERAARVGADHHLTKPFQSIRTLIATVKNLIEPEPRAAATETPEFNWPNTHNGISPEPADQSQRQTGALLESVLAQDDEAVLSAKEPDTGDLAKPATPSASVAQSTWPTPQPFVDPMRNTVELITDAPNVSAPLFAGSAPTSFSLPWEDDVLELDDVLPSLPPMIVLPPQPAPVTLMSPPSGGAITQSVKMTSVEAVTTIPANIIDEIVSRVAAQVTNQISQQLAQQFSQFAARVSQDVLAQLAAQATAGRAPANPQKRENGESLLDL